MSQTQFSNTFKSAIETFLKGAPQQEEGVHSVMSTLVHHGFIEEEFGPGTKKDPVVLDQVEDEIKRCLLEKLKF